MGVGEDAGGVDDGGTFGGVGGDSGLKSVQHLSRLIVTLVEVAEIDVGFGSFADQRRTGEFGFGSGEVFFLLRYESEQAMRFGGEVRLHSGGERSCFVESASNEGGGFNVKLAKVAHGADVLRIQLNCALEASADLDGKIESGDGIGVRGLEPVGAAEPHLIVAARRSVGNGELALANGAVGYVLGIVDAAEKLVGLGIAWLYSKDIVKPDSCFIDTALLKQEVGLSRVGQKQANTEGEEKRKDNTDAGWRDEHGQSTILTGNPLVS